MQRKAILLIITLWFFCLSSISYGAQTVSTSPTPLGLWRTYDLDGIARSIVRFYMAGNKLQAQIVKILPTKGQKPTDLCTACPPPRKNKPKAGMVIVWGLSKQADGTWSGGNVLDTDSGSTYRCQLDVSPDNRILHFHAYVAIPLLGKTVDWVRVM